MPPVEFLVLTVFLPIVTKGLIFRSANFFENPDSDTLHLQVIDGDVWQFRVFRMQDYLRTFMEQPLERVALALHVGDNDVSIMGGFLFSDKYHIAVVNASADHGVAGSKQEVHSIAVCDTGRKIDVLLQPGFRVSWKTA